MGGTGVIDNFLGVFTRYIDSGFGLLSGEMAFIATTLIVIDVTLAALFWAWGADDDIIARLIKKTLFVGVFAWIIGNWNNLARIVFDSFAGLGLMASGTGFSTADLMRPGRVAQTGLDAGRPLLDSISDLMGYWSFFENFIQIACLMFAWALVLLAFFILAVQLFVTLIEFKLTTLAGFVLVPFGLFNKTAFMAERVLGNVISSGIKVLVLAVIIGIGSTLFSQFTAGFGGATPTIDDAMAIVLAALSLLGLGIFGPGIATGLVSGGPQLGAGAAVGTGLAAGGMVLAAGGAAGGAAMLGAKGGAAALSGGAAAVRGGATAAGAASAAYSLGSLGQSGAAGVASGLGGVARAAGSAAVSPLKRAASRASESVKSSFSDGVKGGFGASGGSSTMGTVGGAAEASAPAAAASATPPAWARRMKGSQALNHGATIAAHAVRSGDSHGPGSSVNLSESDRS
ncbi:P-type conjugative transfer protein TrbL [Brucella anthropi]|uniref:P-type conjugative transfer protein TrbL n=1 Tax=Brucella anthropi TaxID=529 RepID=UPI002165619B|nr:P-type conjugative transfer protein TrbL [Brucella anthropi]UVV69220.1 P-type conjugative transfer protein TrbL [Brucella anthropi]